jgi:hypothetical protein
MIEHELIQEALQPPEGWVDTPEQAQLRECLTGILSGHDAVTTTRICFAVITVMRDQLLTGAAQIRRSSAAVARKTMSPDELAKASGQTRQTVSRLLTEAKNT